MSDARVKCNITDLELSGLEIIDGIRLREFNYMRHPDSPKNKGLIAQELEEVYPDAVSYYPRDDLYGVSREALVIPLIKSVQELSEEVKALKGDN